MEYLDCFGSTWHVRTLRYSNHSTLDQHPSFCLVNLILSSAREGNIDLGRPQFVMIWLGL